MSPEHVAREFPQAARARAHWRAAVTSAAVTESAAGTRLNKKGLETRARLLDVAIRCLADSGGEPVSANHIAKDAGVTWGTLQHQFGDLDGLWVAVITEIHSRSWLSDPDTWPVRSGTLREQVATAIDAIWNYLATTEGRALTALRISLPPRRSDVIDEYPLTAAALAARELDWVQGFDYLMDGLDLDPDKLHRVQCLLPAAIRGLSNERDIGFTSDLEVARAALTDAVVALLT
ncbi:TetR/AcrR family transcriptional regulator [Mycobacterium sp. OTB74]|jgi:AcrR family transcriptional regulator|uniref:TetR/AcrR family transcriptional regulator n=1 Tax=Mycobacterium sp. OTB74 TaxID=1853452 RepID=UPI002474EBC3|nr:TetR/AcrR family transcriptional regulator [Mycobacterium sp. OTB74]MDH6243274.1 AcrR family transcriptional regulator [Mycobacterium sp. OTB74]